MKKKRYFGRGVMFLLCLVFAVAFLPHEPCRGINDDFVSIYFGQLEFRRRQFFAADAYSGMDTPLYIIEPDDI